MPPVLTTDPDLRAVETDLLAMGKAATTEAYNAAVKIGQAVTTGTPTVLTDLEKLGADRVIAMLPSQFRGEATIAAGLATTAEATLNTDVAGIVAKEIGFVLQRLHVAAAAIT